MGNVTLSGVIGKVFPKYLASARNAWNDPNSGFKSSSYGQQFQRDADAYAKKRNDYLKTKGWSEDSLARGSGLYDVFVVGEGSDNGPYETRKEIRRSEAVARNIGYAPDLTKYYENWVNAGRPSYKEATDTKADTGTRDNLAPAPSDSDSSAPVKKGYDIKGSSARGHGYAPSSDDSGEGGTGQRTGDSSDGLGTGTPAGERLKKQFKPLGK